MKAIVLFCVTIAIVAAAELTGESKDKFKNVHDKCQSDEATRVDNEVFEKLRMGEKLELPSNFGAHTLCMSRGFGWQKDDGKVDKEGIRKSVLRIESDPTKVEETMNECAVDKEDAEKTALHLFKCFSAKTGTEHHHHHH